jgi:tetratricopeptide (TPR) repeat protein
MKNLRLLLAMSVACSTAVVAQVPHQSEVQIARELLKQGKSQEAIAKVDPIIASAMAKDAKDPDAICPGVAVAFLQNFMREDNPGVTVSVENDWCEAMLVKGYALTELKRPAEAAQTLGALVRHDTNNAQYLIEYGFAVRSSGETARALEIYKKAESLASRSTDKQLAAHWRAAALRGQGYAYIDLQNWDDAAKAYQKSLKYEPDNELAKSELRFVADHRPQ